MVGGIDAHGIGAQDQRKTVADGAVVLDQKNAHGGAYGITLRPASGPADGSRCQRVSPVRMTRVMARRLRSRHTPKAEIWLLPVVMRRQGFLAAARTPLRVRMVEHDARGTVTAADCRTAARRSRAKQERE